MRGESAFRLQHAPLRALAKLPRLVYLSVVLSPLRRAGAVSGAALVFLAVAALGASASPEQQKPSVVYVTAFCTKTGFTCDPFQRAVRRTGVRGRILSPDPREDLFAIFAVLARQGHSLIVVDPTFSDVLVKVARSFPKQAFAVPDVPLSDLGRNLKNVRSLLLRANEASYLAGWLAARLEKPRPGKDAVGVVGGFPIQQVDDFIVGFQAGAKAAFPGMTVLRGYSRDFGDPTKCEAVARQQIARGAGAVFNVAGACGFGTLDAAKRANVWAIGVDFDQSDLGPHVLTSVVKGYEAGFVALLEEARAKRVRTGITTQLDLRRGGSDLGRISPRVPKSLRSELERVRARIVSGDLRVPGAF